MLVSQFQEARRFMGRLDAGQDLAAAFATICKDNGIRSGWIQASALLRNAVVQAPRGDGGGLDEAGVHPGVLVFPHLQGNVSLRGDAIDVRLYAAGYGAGGDGAVAALGLLRGGEVVACEFFLIACDDVSLVRDGDGDDFAPWVQLQTVVDSKPRPVMSVPLEGPMARPAAPAPHVLMDEDETSELNILEMAVGDYVDHPRFGVCKIVHAPVDERVSIRLPAGKHVDLHLGVMRVHAAKMVGGRKVFQIEMKKRG